MPDMPDVIIGTLPPPPVDEIEDGEDDRLDPVRVGSLPPPPHRINHTHFTPDGKIVICACGWQSHLCPDEETFEIEWMEHL